MPTARPIIIEKFIDHTDNGMIAVARWSAAKPTAMPDTARSSGSPAATAVPKRGTTGSAWAGPTAARPCAAPARSGR